MTPEQDILKALRALADGDREAEAPPEVEDRLRFAFRRRQRLERWRIRVAWAMAAAAVVAVAMVASSRQGRHVEPARVVNRAPEVFQSSTVSVEPVAPVATPRVARVRRAPDREEIMTDFFPLMDDASPVERGTLFRVSLPATAMRTVGLPVREDRLSDRVQADVLVSEEGMATAIRFVKYSGENK